ncbi:MAG TPA: putative toxin-antitoxin system toxin component, PIN family [Gammaproteobacteria bacterium]|nr:putative toxin-antitoxin system toxin component, PIN family [Gammaproteobacteria bacterium]
MDIIIDTNVLISGIFWSGAPYKILKAWQSRKITLAVSQDILDEYDRVSKSLSIKYPKIDLSQFIELLAINSKIYIPLKLKDKISRDPDDDKFIACALAAKIKFIVSGDQDLLSIREYEGIKMIKPADFIKKYPRLFRQNQ